MNRRTFLTAAGVAGAASLLAAPAPKEVPPGIRRLMFTRGMRHRTIDPDGENESDIPGLKDLKGGIIPTIQSAKLSPDGKRLAWIYADPKRGTQLRIRDFDAEGPGEFIDSDYTAEDWLGPTELIVHVDDHDPKSQPEERYYIYDVKTRKIERLELGRDERISQVLSDGRMLTRGAAERPAFDTVEWRTRKGTGAAKSLFKGSLATYPNGFVMSGDARHLAFAKSDPAIGWPGGERKWELFVQTLDGTKPVLLATIPEGFVMSGIAWEPSCKRLAYSTSPSSQVGPDEQRSQLFVIDADGGKPKGIAEHDPKATDHRILRLTAWR